MPTAKYILALDQGTTSSRAILFDQAGQIKNISQAEFTQHYPQLGWVEHNPDEIFVSQYQVARQCLQASQIKPEQIAGIGITNQRETTVVWDKVTGRPIYPAIVWQDRRTADLCQQLTNQGLAPIITQKTGLLLDAYFSGTKIAWILDNVPQARSKAEAGQLLFGTIDTWLIWNLTKGASHVTDPSNASRTLLFNIHTQAWDQDLLTLFNIPLTMLPQVMESSGIMGQTHPEFFGQAIAIAGVAGDQQAATLGNACLQSGMAKNTYGTGCFLLLNTGQQVRSSQNNLISTTLWNINAQVSYALEGSIFIGGAVVQWLRDGLGIIRHASEIEALAATVPDNGGVYFVPAFAGLGAPYWDPKARGCIFGLTRGSTKGHLARAALEAIALQTLDILDCMQKDAAIPLTTLRVDGGASRNNMLMQCQADVLGLTVERPMITETTALGAAYLAGLAVDFWAGIHELTSLWKLDQSFAPQMTAQARADLLGHWHKAVEKVKTKQ